MRFLTAIWITVLPLLIVSQVVADDARNHPHATTIVSPAHNSLAFLPAAFVVNSNPDLFSDVSLESLWIKRGQEILHRIAGDDTAAFFGVNPSLQLIYSPAVHASVSHSGTMYVSSGMLELVKSESEYAFIIAHEMAHILLDHHHSTDHGAAIRTELQADSLAIQLLRESGFEGSAGEALLTRLSVFGPRSGLTIERLFPSLKPRLTALRAAMAH